MAFPHFGGYNSFVPAATGQIIGYMRNPKRYRVNNYVQLIPTQKTVFVWYKLHPDDMGQRVLTDAEWVWTDGAKRPENHANKMRFDTVEAQCIRRNYDFVLGWETLEQADVNVLVAHTSMAQNQCMTNYTKRIIALLENSANWEGNTAAANDLNDGHGYWDLASSDPTSPNYLAIKKSLDAAASRILLSTNNAVDWEKEAPKLLISPELALKISETDEIHNYIRESPYSIDQIKGRKAGQNARWGLPDSLYGFDLEIEASTVVTERPQTDGGLASTTSGSPAPRRYIKSSDSAVILSRDGGIDGVAGAPNFSTVQAYYYKSEIQLEVQDVSWDRRTLGSCVEHKAEVLAAPASGFLISDVLSA